MDKTNIFGSNNCHSAGRYAITFYEVILWVIYFVQNEKFNAFTLMWETQNQSAFTLLDSSSQVQLTNFDKRRFSTKKGWISLCPKSGALIFLGYPSH